MNQSVTLECGGCGRLHNSPTGTMPAGWSLDSELEKPLCGDCSAAGAQRDLQIANDHVRCETAIPLLSCAYIDLAYPDCSLVQPIDIAAGLRAPRFCGQTRQFYTIAQHCCLVLRLVAPTARSLGGEKGLQLRRCALMHDAAEAIIHHITRPLKIQLPDYRRIERLFEARLAAAMGWEWTEFRRVTVKRADIAALAIEQRDIKGISDAWPIFDGLDREALKSITIRRAWQPDEAQDRFLEAYADLFPTGARKAA
jgi:uncharacterized protein